MNSARRLDRFSSYSSFPHSTRGLRTGCDQTRQPRLAASVQFVSGLAIGVEVCQSSRRNSAGETAVKLDNDVECAGFDYLAMMRFLAGLAVQTAFFTALIMGAGVGDDKRARLAARLAGGLLSSSLRAPSVAYSL